MFRVKLHTSAYSIDSSVDIGPLHRVVGDVNQQINETTVVRVVGMYHDQDIADRDHVENDCWGLAGSVAFGLGANLN